MKERESNWRALAELHEAQNYKIFVLFYPNFYTFVNPRTLLPRHNASLSALRVPPDHSQKVLPGHSRVGQGQSRPAAVPVATNCS